VTIEDLAGDGDHYAASVVSETFRGKSRVQQHQIVYAACKGAWAASCTPSPSRPQPLRRGQLR
jgi:stress-induced morphogen